MNRDLRPEWAAIADARETALAKRVVKSCAPGKELVPLRIGDCVQIQNQTGNHPNKWFNTGIVTGVLPNRQYHVVVDGSRRVSLRNRRFLKKILPVSRRAVPELDPVGTLTADTSGVRENSTRFVVPERNDAHETNREPMDSPQHLDVPVAIPKLRTEPFTELHTEPASEPPIPLRRSGRERAPRKLFSAKMTGKSHEE